MDSAFPLEQNTRGHHLHPKLITIPSYVDSFKGSRYAFPHSISYSYSRQTVNLLAYFREVEIKAERCDVSFREKTMGNTEANVAK